MLTYLAKKIKQLEENFHKLPPPHSCTYLQSMPIHTAFSRYYAWAVYTLARTTLIPCSLDLILSTYSSTLLWQVFLPSFHQQCFPLYWITPISKQIYSNVFQLKTNPPLTRSSSYCRKLYRVLHYSWLCPHCMASVTAPHASQTNAYV